MAVNNGPLVNPGPKTPGKYGFVGNNYNQWGEQPGLTYDPDTDKYYTPNKWNIITAQRKQQQDAANAINNPPKDPSLLQQIAPIAAGSAALWGGKQAVQGLASLGSSSAATGATEATGSGLLSSGVGGGSAAGAAEGTSTLGASLAPGTDAATGLTLGVDGSAGAAAGTEAATGGIAANAAGLGVGPLAAIAAGTYLGGKAGYNLLKGKEDKSTQGLIGRGLLGVATGGISEIARPFFNATYHQQFQVAFDYFALVYFLRQ